MRDFITSALITGLGVIAWCFITLSLLLALKNEQEAIELDPSLWHCEALDPADGQCAIYIKAKPDGL